MSETKEANKMQKKKKKNEEKAAKINVAKNRLHFYNLIIMIRWLIVRRYASTINEFEKFKWIFHLIELKESEKNSSSGSWCLRTYVSYLVKLEEWIEINKSEKCK